MSNLVNYFNDTNLSNTDPLIKMAILHFQFESIHPFYDGNGRTGRILNLLYLVLQGLLDLPIVYLSRYIIQNKSEYYKRLQAVRDTQNWEDWLLFILTSIQQTAKNTITLIHQIKTLMLDTKARLRETLPKIYSQDLLNNLFRHPYTKIEFIVNEIGVTRLTASKHLEKLSKHQFLTKQKLGRSNYYINTALCQLLAAT